MFFKSIKIKGYKGFDDTGEISLCVPDGKTLGSGLNIFVGENGTGKTSILKAISFLTISSFYAQNKISFSDFNSKKDDIEIVGCLDKSVEYKMPPPWKKTLDIEQFVAKVKKRDRKSPGKYLSPSLTISNILEPTSRKPDWAKEEIADFYLGLDNSRFVGKEELHIFYFGTDRNKQTRKGFSTTLARVIDDLNWKFIKDADQKDVLEKWKKYYSKVVAEDIADETKKILKKKFCRDDLSNISLELINLKEPYSEAYLALSEGNDLTQIPLADLGSGVEFLFSILFLRGIADKSKGTIIYCIDEPELSLHPQWQKILFDILKLEAKDKQVFLATHSPYFIDPYVLGNIKKLSSDNKKIKINALGTKQLSDKKIPDLFSLENREMLFSKLTILVEGREDCRRFRKYLQSHNNDIFIIDGLQNFDRVKRVCTDYGIKFKAVVDLDYLRTFDGLLPSLTKEEIAAIEELNSLYKMKKLAGANEKLIKEIEKLAKKIEDEPLKCLSSKMLSKMLTDQSYKLKIENKIEELISQNVYVLRKGMIEDYLDLEGRPLSDSLEKEISEIFNNS